METVIRYWRFSLAAGLAVIAAVAVLLETVARTAESIQDGTAKIWEVGKLIANNTVHVPLLVRINHHVAAISGAADEIAQAAGRIQQVATSDGRRGR